MSVVYDNNVLNPIRDQQASHRWLCSLDSDGSLPQLDIYFSMTTDGGQSLTTSKMRQKQSKKLSQFHKAKYLLD